MQSSAPPNFTRRLKTIRWVRMVHAKSDSMESGYHLILHNQGHAQVSPTSPNTSKCGAHGIHPATWHPRPLARWGLGSGTTQSLIQEKCPQLPITYRYQLLPSRFSVGNLGQALYWCRSLRNPNGSNKIEHTSLESKGSPGTPPCVFVYPSHLI